MRALTERIGQALAELTLQAERVEALALVARAQRIFSTADEPPAAPAPLAQELEVRRRFVLGYRLLRERWPDRFTALQARIDRYESALTAAGLDPRHLTPRTYTFARVLRYVVQSVLVFALLLPPAAAGALVHYPAYRIVGYVATGISKGDESALATVKLLAATLLFPLTFASSAFVPVRTMPGWMQAYARNQPVTVVVDACRHLMIGTPGSVPRALAWSLALLAVFAPLAVRKYRKAS